MQSHRGKKPVNFSSFFNYSHICRFGSGIPAPSNNLQKLPTFYFLKPRFLSSFVQSHYTKIITERLQTVMVTLNLSGPKYHIGAIDQGTSSTRFLLFDESSKIVLSHSVPVFTESPKPGWAEQSPNDLLNSVKICLEEASLKAKELNIPLESIKAIGLTNQRETTICWDSVSGEPLAPALVWFDTRTKDLLNLYRTRVPGNSLDIFREKCGLPMSTYFSVLKLRWLIDNVPDVMTAYRSRRLKFGTVDSWILYKLLNGLHATDVTNASRTMLMNLRTLKWDPEILEFFDIEAHCLPEIRSSAEEYGKIASGPFQGIPISGVLGDQQAALVGHKCFNVGDTKNTYGTGCFLLMNTGDQLIASSHGLVSTVAYQFGRDSKACYANEGSIAMSGKVFDWLRVNVGMIKADEQIDQLAMAVPDSNGVIFIPTFTGVFAPYWRGDITGSIRGLSLKTTRHHICRAAIESICYQTRMVLECLQSDLGTKITKLRVDGGVAKSHFILQLQSNYLGMSIEKPELSELTALGAATAAGLGVGLWSSLKDIPLQSAAKSIIFSPEIDKYQADTSYRQWLRMLQKEMKI